MNEEIKEILKDDDELLVVYNDNSTRTFDTLTIDVLDYITNLQQENEELNRMCELYSKSLYNAELTDYKSRLEKASNKLDSMFANREENKILDLLELDKIVKGDKQ